MNGSSKKVNIRVTTSLFHTLQSALKDEVRLQHGWSTEGFICGVETNDSTGLWICSSSDSFPLGCELIGLFSTEAEISPTFTKTFCSVILAGMEDYKLPIIKRSKSNTDQLCLIHRCMLDEEAGSLDDTEEELVPTDDNKILTELVPIKVHLNTLLPCDPENFHLVEEEMVPEYQFLLQGTNFTVGSKDKTTVMDIYGHVKDREQEELDEISIAAAEKKKMKEKLKKKRQLDKKPLVFTVKGHEVEEKIVATDVEGFLETVDDTFTSTISFYFLYPGSKKVSDLSEALIYETVTHFRRICTFVAEHKRVPVMNCFLPVSSFFYNPLFTGDEQEQLEQRRKLHQMLFLPCDTPMFRPMNRYQTLGQLSPKGQLINPHTTLGPSGVKGGQVQTVRGKYAYHHYMQDGISDDGWGCAYRSLQTIVSWFRFHGSIDQEVPTHQQIQQALVDCKDKPLSIVGSSTWIGSQEISYVLDQLYHISCKTSFVSSGQELSLKGRELLDHFSTEGTPVMIGGGNLAHTIIGVHFNDQTGDIKFLILDPHYTGKEDLTIIHKKGWCGWKDMKFWDTTSYYNMCLPQRPRVL